MAFASRPLHVAVIGAGIAGSTCAWALARAGCAVQVFDKSRGPGGRLATRRLSWVDRQGREHGARFDHGAPGFAARGAAFRAFLAEALPPAHWVEETPRLAPGSRAAEAPGARLRPRHDMPALCRALLDGIPVVAGQPVERLHRGPLGWQVGVAGQRAAGPFDAVLLALPPAQAAPLLGEHRHDWARRAALALMQPCWTLMAVAEGALPDLGWDLALPEGGPLASIHRQDLRPGCAAPAVPPGFTQWVAHARAGWSRLHLEQPAEAVQAQLLAALETSLAATLQAGLAVPQVWAHATVHRWRYALPAPAGAPQPGAPGARCAPCWWDGTRGLGACGDFLGGEGVEGAWLSAQALVEAVRREAGLPPGAASTMPGTGAARPASGAGNASPLRNLPIVPALPVATAAAPALANQPDPDGPGRPDDTARTGLARRGTALPSRSIHLH